MPLATVPPTRRQQLEALALALVCAVLFLRESLLPGRALVPYPPELFDVPMAEAIANGTFDATDARRGNVAMGDKYLQSLCWDRVMQDRYGHGEIPRWTKDIGGGAPFVPQMAQPFEPIGLLLAVLPSAEWYGWWFLVHQVLFGWLCYRFLRRLGCEHGSALLGLCAAVLGLWTQAKVHHNVVLTAALSLWPMLSMVHDLVVGSASEVLGGLLGGRARRRAIAGLALWTGLSWLSGFVVVSLQATYLAAAFALLLTCQRPRGERLRALVPVGLGLGLGALLSLANMLPVLFAAADSARAGTFDPARLAGLGLEWDHALAACWPDLLSWGADRFYPPLSGESPFAYATRVPFAQLVLLEHPLRPENGSALHNWVESSFAVGLVPLGCALLGLWDRARRPLVVFFAVAALLAFAIATADPPFLQLARLVPGLAGGDLRRLLFTTAMALPVLAAFGADALLRGERRWPAATLLGAVAAVSLAALAWLAAHRDEASFVRGYARLYVADHDHPDVRAIGGDVDRAFAYVQANARPGEALENHARLAVTAWRALLAAAAAAGVLLLRPHRRAWPLCAIAIAELVHAGLGPVQTVPSERITTPPRVLAPLLAAAEPNGVRPRLQRLVVADGARTGAALPGNIPGFLHIEDGSAYNPLPPARSEQFWLALEPDRPGKPSVAYGGAGIGVLHDPASLRSPLADLFGVRFVVTRDDVATSPQLVDRTPPGTGGFRLLERTTTLPRATFVREVDLLPERTARLAALAQQDRDTAHRVVLEDAAAPRPQPGGDATATATITSHRDERVAVRVQCAADGYLRLADPFDPGWRAAVDGQPTTVYAADHYLRAVYVAAGDHEVVFTYDGARVVWPLRLSLLVLAGLTLLWLLPGRRR